MAKILLVEDEASLLELLSEVVSELGHAVFTARNGLEALEAVEKNPPDIIISDVMMPVMNGYTLLEQISLKPNCRSIKTVLISAAPIDRSRKPPAHVYMSKPYQLAEIIDLIEKLASLR